MTEAAPQTLPIRAYEDELMARVEARKSLIKYCEYVQPGYQASKIHHALAEKLEAVERGEIKRLLVTAPPQHGKSRMVSVHFPAWCLGKHPKWNVIQTSYGLSLSLKHSRTARDFFISPEFHNVFPKARHRPGRRGQELVTNIERQAAQEWGTNQGGTYYAVGIGGGLTGMGFDIGIIDDPVKDVVEANSELVNERNWEWYGSVFRTRMSPDAAIILTMCMTGDTPVLMSDGTEHPLRDIKAGDRVATYDNGKLGTTTVLNHMNNGPDILYRIRTINGNEVRANERHPFLVEDGGKLRWMRLRDLRVTHKIITLKDRRENGKERPVWLKGVDSPLSVGDTACPIITNSYGKTEPVSHHTIPLPVGTPESKTDTGLPLPSMTQCLRHNRGSAPFVNSPPERTCERIGEGNYVSIIATKLERSEDSYATTVISQWDMPKPNQISLQWLNTSDFTLEQIVSIEPAGIEDVFDIEIERTENFIANGLVSHNTRWSKKDLMQKILDQIESGTTEEHWEVLHMPAIATADDPHDPTGRSEGEALWPEKYGIGWLLRQKEAMRAKPFEALYQGNPTIGEGEILKRAWWKFYAVAVGAKFPCVMEDVVQSWDCSFKDLNTSDYVVGQVWGRQGTRRYLLDQVRGRMNFLTTINAIRSLTDKWPEATRKYIEDKANGTAAIEVLKKEIQGVIAVEPEGGKITRVNAVSGIIEAGDVFLPDPSECLWVHDFIEECAAFPNGRNDDQVDTMSQALYHMMTIGSTMFPPGIVDQNSRPSPPPYDYTVEYHGVIGASQNRNAPVAFGIGHLHAGRVIIDLLTYFNPANGALDWGQIAPAIKMQCRQYRVEDLLHDGYEREAMMLHFNNFLLNELPFTPQHRLQVYTTLENRMYQGQIEYPRNDRLISELKSLQAKAPDGQFSVGPDALANLAHHMFTGYINTREGIDDDRNRNWPEDDPWETQNISIMGGELHT